MAVVKINDKVRYNGRITTIEELDKEGLIEYEECNNFYSSRTASGTTTKYFANIKEAGTGWEIGKTAYLSRTGQKDKIGKRAKLINSEGLEITKDAINTFNYGRYPLANDHWNQANHLGTMAEHRYLKTIANYYQINKLTNEDIKRYIEKELITASI